MKKILLTGGFGFIGSNTAIELLKEYEVIIVDNFSNSQRDVSDKLKCQFYDLDITKNIDEIFEKHNIYSVIHFAAYKSVNESVEDPLKYYYNNIYGLINLLQTMKKYNVKNIIFSSSATVYGNPETLPLTENSKINTLNPYGRTKLFGEEILKDMKDMKSICLRYFNPVGASKNGLFKENPKGIPNNLFPYIVQVIEGKREKLFIFGGDYPTNDGTGIRDYIHVIDLANGHIAALKYLEKMENSFEVFNLGTGKGYSVLEIVNTFNKFLDKKIPYEIVKRRNGDAAEVYADCAKALFFLKWGPKFNLEDMIRDTLSK